MGARPREATAAGIKPAGKRQKTASGSVKLPSDVVQGEMRLRLEQHTDAVGAVCWNTEDVIYTGSMDRHVHKVRLRHPIRTTWLHGGAFGGKFNCHTAQPSLVVLTLQSNLSVRHPPGDPKCLQREAHVLSDRG